MNADPHVHFNAVLPPIKKLYLNIEIGVNMFAKISMISFFLVEAGPGPRPRTQRVKNDCTLPADYYNFNQLNYYI